MYTYYKLVNGEYIAFRNNAHFLYANEVARLFGIKNTNGTFATSIVETELEKVDKNCVFYRTRRGTYRRCYSPNTIYVALQSFLT